jgi:hypothetical protein
MQNSNEKAAKALLANVNDAIENCEFLAITTGDDDFKLLAIYLKLGLVAKHKGDLLEFMQALSNIIDTHINDGQDAVEDILADARFAPSLN